ncbi:3-hydroxyacyl-CoA dehydrogenase NAD-binding domain-containing protein [Niveispirillum fermenti]|uniref:3-hydroxyacyl-CoA dehydrogenase NAD-binding domain-containing protein n=1 Tax=Niveispirillum fermenti TaxID=1233113 RepID=UPI003A8997CA
MAPVSTRLDGNILVVTADNPPVNALSAAVRGGLADAIAQARADAGIKAVVIRAAGRTFFAGADITEFGKPPVEPGLPEVIDLIEQCGKPVVAAIHGTALGGGLEVALGCHYRIATATASMGLPEVKLGILPGAGGTQRLPRVIGVADALPMIVTGAPIPAGKALAKGLVDRLTEDASLEADAIAFANEVAGCTDYPISSRRSDKTAATPAGVFEDYRAANAARLRGQDAPQACIEAVEAAVSLPFAEGAAKERTLFLKLVAGAQSKALRHVFFAERAAAKIDGLPPDLKPLAIAKVGIIGAGTMGGGIAMNFLSAGIPVVMLERDQPALDRGVSIIRKNYDATAAKGRMSAGQVGTAMGLLTTSLDYAALADCDLIIEAVFETMEIKREVFARLDKVARPGAILATNTSYLNVDEIAAATSRPDWVIGLHFFSPANVMKLLEVVRGAKTSPLVLATGMALARRIGKIAVMSGVCHGFIGNRILAARTREANALLMEGARPADIDRVLTTFGLPMGPFQMADLAGLDLGWDPAKSSGSTIREVLCERGRRGQKTGKGFYDYDEKRNRTASAEVDAIIAEFAARSGKEQRVIDDQEIRERLLYPMVNEGALILEEGIAQRASDIDIVWLNGYGWPAWRGGPMFWADNIGLDVVLKGLEKHAPHLTDFRLSGLLRDKAAAGGRFNG